MHARRIDAHGLSSSESGFLSRFLLHLHLDFDLQQTQEIYNSEYVLAHFFFFYYYYFIIMIIVHACIASISQHVRPFGRRERERMPMAAGTNISRSRFLCGYISILIFKRLALFSFVHFTAKIIETDLVCRCVQCKTILSCANWVVFFFGRCCCSYRKISSVELRCECWRRNRISKYISIYKYVCIFISYLNNWMLCPECYPSNILLGGIKKI